ncbi:MAG: hypothetical protein KDI29_00065 [Pseudomonadales bacterium]|nr:hypothetical protein [Pseudomonadales bacterium]
MTLALLLAGCNAAGRAPLEPIMPDIRVQTQNQRSLADSDPINGDSFVMNSVAAGGAGGVLVGTLAGLGCGPLFFFCAPLAGATIGAVGFIAGGIFGAATSLNREEQQAFMAILDATFSDTSPDTALTGSFVTLAGERWTLVDASPDRLIMLRFDEFNVVQLSPDRFSLKLVASFTVENPLQQQSNPRRYRFEQQTPARELDYFLEQTGTNFRNEFTRGVDALVNQMVNSL